MAGDDPGCISEAQLLALRQALEALGKALVDQTGGGGEPAAGEVHGADGGIGPVAMRALAALDPEGG